MFYHMLLKNTTLLIFMGFLLVIFLPNLVVIYFSFVHSMPPIRHLILLRVDPRISELPQFRLVFSEYRWMLPILHHIFLILFEVYSA